MRRIQENQTGPQEAHTKSRKRKNGPGRIVAAGCGVLLAAALAGGATYYVLRAEQYEDTFFPNTVINGMDASDRTVEEVKELIEIGISGYRLTVEGRDGVQEEIRGTQIDLHPDYDGSLEQILAVQQPLLWGLHLMEGTSHTIETMVVFDQNKLQQAVEGLACMDESAQTAPENARLSEYIPGTGYEVIPEGKGTQLIPQVVVEGVADGIRNMADRVSLEEMGAYRTAAITARDPELLARAEAWNRYTDMEITYQFGDVREILDGEIIHTWLTADDQGIPVVDDQGNPVLDEAKVAEYVAELGKKYNTAYKPKTLKTTYGPTVTITGGNYGWRINQKEETAALMDIVRWGQSQEREPVYIQTAASHGENDYGDTYVEINLTAQHLYFYKNGSLVVDSDFVSGNVARGHTTPPGAFPITYKQRNAVLKGQGYASPVSYWMPFNGGIGMHDASWRGSFGGKIYRTNGSHGCVNLPVSAARTIYEEISAGMPVLCYNLEGTSGAAAVAQGAAPSGGSAGAGSSATAVQPAVPAAAPAASAAVQPAAPASPVPETAAAQETAPSPETQPVPETVPDPAQSQPQGGGTPVIAAQTGAERSGPGVQTSPAAQETTPQPAPTPQPETAPQPAPAPQPETPAQTAPAPQTTEAPPPAPVPQTVPDPYAAPAPGQTPAGSPGSPGGPSPSGNGAVSAPGM